MNPFDMFQGSGHHGHPHAHFHPQAPMATLCPSCHKPIVPRQHQARRIGGTIGALAGAASGVSGILSAARIGMEVGALAGPVGSVVTAVAAATLRGILGATLGCEIGTVLGGLLDKHVLQSGSCPHCGFDFNSQESSPMSFGQQPWPHTMAFPMGTGPDDDEPDGEGHMPGGQPGLT